MKREKPKRRKRDFFDVLQRKIQKVKAGKLDPSTMRKLQVKFPERPELDESPTRESDPNLAPSEDSSEGSLSES